MKWLPGVFQARKKNGDIYFRSSVTFRGKHISLGSFATQEEAHRTYTIAANLLKSEIRFLPDDYRPCELPFSKWVVLNNFKNNGLYIKTPIYLQANYFEYYLSREDVLLFDADDLFYYSHHSIMRRGGHLFVADYGMQVNIASRYGIKNFAVENRDYRFVNGNDHDYRYANIEILNSYHGVTRQPDVYAAVYVAKIHINGDHIIGRYPTDTEAAIAYNKAADLLQEAGIGIQYASNYLSELTSEEYHRIYREISFEPRFSGYISGLQSI